MTQVSVCQSQSKSNSVYPPLSAAGLSIQPNFKKGGLDRTSTFRGGCWERGGDFFQGGGVCNCHINQNLKYLMTKKVYKQKYFSL